MKSWKMKQNWSTLYNLLQHPYFNLLIGIALVISGVMEFEESEETQLRVHGMILLGSFQVFKVILELMEGLDLLLESSKQRIQLPSLLQKLSNSYQFHMLIAVLLIIIGLIETVSELIDDEAGVNSVWHLGLIATGMINFSAAAANMTDALAFAAEAAEESPDSRLQKWTNKLYFPKIEIALGLFVVAVSIWEEFINNAEFYNVGAHHTLMIYATVHILKVLTSFAVTIDMVNDVERRKKSLVAIKKDSNPSG